MESGSKVQGWLGLASAVKSSLTGLQCGWVVFSPTSASWLAFKPPTKSLFLLNLVDFYMI